MMWVRATAVLLAGALLSAAPAQTQRTDPLLQPIHTFIDAANAGNKPYVERGVFAYTLVRSGVTWKIQSQSWAKESPRN